MSVGALSQYVSNIARGFGVVALVLLAPTLALGASIYDTRLPDGTYKITIEGPIEHGDDTELLKTVRNFESSGKGVISSVHLDSPGGYVNEGLAMGRFIKQKGYITVVERNKRCVSICFFMFMLGQKRIITSSSRLGMHGASINGIDDPQGTERLLAVMDQNEFFIPEYLSRSILHIPHKDMYYFTKDDFEAMQFDVDVRH